MSVNKLKAQLLGGVLEISEKCVAAALIAAGVVTTGHSSEAAAADSAVGDTRETRITAVVPTVEAAPSSEGAIHLSLVGTDPESGEQIATHYSHASHSSHASHYSHYSSR